MESAKYRRHYSPREPHTGKRESPETLHFAFVARIYFNSVEQMSLYQRKLETNIEQKLELKKKAILYQFPIKKYFIK